MKKIGLFLESAPSGGGMFQYCQSLLDAVAALPSDRFTVVVGYTSELWLELLKDYHVQTVYVPHGEWGRASSIALTVLGLPMGLWRKLCPLFYPLAQTLIKARCDLWIFPSQNVLSNLVPVPALVSIHDLMHRYERRFPEASSIPQYIGREHLFSRICRWAKGILVDSETGKKQVIEAYGADKGQIHILPYIAPKYMRSAETPPDFDSRYLLPAKYIFYPAQFWEHKNHKQLIMAMAGLKHELPDLKLVLAGSKKNAFDAVMNLVRERGLTDDVVFLGYVTDADMPELYRRARALVMPTYYGPTNIPPLEAFTVGCPVAISGIYGMPEQVGDAALLFNPDSVDGIADCIRALWTDDQLCSRLAIKGKERAAGWGEKQFNARVEEIITHMVYGVEAENTNRKESTP